MIDEPDLDGYARRRRWVPPERPGWVTTVNAEGRHLDLRGVVPLDQDSLIRTAMSNTGLADFGDDGWREPFEVLVKALDSEAELTLMGRLLTRSDLLQHLEARLQVEATYRAHPEIEDEQIRAPFFIVGQARTGTSFLQHLLAADPENETVRHWEAMFPCPPPETATYSTDLRIARADPLVTMWNRITPSLESIHEFHATVPTENIHLQSLSFQTPYWFSLYGQTPSYDAFMASVDPVEAYRYEQRVLRLLQWRHPRQRWVMKSPMALLHLPTVLQVYPDVCFIWTHRDPVKALASVVSVSGTLHWIRSDVPFIGDSHAQLTNPDLAAGMLSQPIGWLESGALPRERLCNIAYEDFVADPLRTVDEIYAYFGVELSPDRRASMARYIEDSPRSARGGHSYDLGDADEILMEREAFKPYQDYFHVPRELR